MSQNNLQETIEGLSVNVTVDVKTGKITLAEETIEAILQAFRDVVPEEKKDWYKKTAFGNLKKEPRAEVWGYNQCRLDILKELGGGNE